MIHDWKCWLDGDAEDDATDVLNCWDASASTSAEWMNAAAEKFPALLDAAERCAAAEAQAKAAGDLLRAAKVARDRLIDTGSPKTAAALAAAIEAAERAGVKP